MLRNFPAVLASKDKAKALTSMGVLVVSYNTYDLTLQCVQSLVDYAIAKPSDIVVVDNASPDGSGKKLAQALPAGVQLILSDKNGGYGAGINLGIQALKTDLVLALNPDTYFQHDNIEPIFKAFEENPQLGVAGLRLINPDGSLQYSARCFYSLLDIIALRTPLGMTKLMQKRINSHLVKRKWAHQEPFRTDWVLGTGFVVRRSAFDAVGKMDERYFLYFEEVDLCARMWMNGWEVMALPSVELVHEHQRQSAKHFWSAAAQIHLKSMRRFFLKFGIPWWRRPSRNALHNRLNEVFLEKEAFPSSRKV